MAAWVGVVWVVLAATLAGGASAGWLEARTPRFTVYSDGSERQLRQHAARLEDFDRLLRDLVETPPGEVAAEPLAVYLVESEGALEARFRRRVGGFYLAGPSGTAAVAVRSNASRLMSATEVLQHEYAHHFMMRYYPGYAPAWYVEGFAEYLATAQFADGRAEVGKVNPGRAQSLLTRSWTPVSRLLTVSPHGLTQEQRQVFYAESWLLVHYLLSSTPRRDSLTRYLAALGRRVAEPDAFRDAFGADHAALDRALKDYREGRLAYGSVPAPPAFDPARVSVQALPPSADDLLLDQVALLIGLDGEADRRERIERVRRAAARHQGDPLAERILARAEIDAGDHAAAATRLDALLVSWPSEADLLYLRGRAADLIARAASPAARASGLAEARGWYQRAIAADPAAYPARYRLALTLPPSSPEALDAILTARRQAPHVAAIALDAARALMAHHRPADALAVLGPIAANPHEPAGARARTLMERIAAGATPPAPTD